jgi:Zn-dependent protease/predicted transcriptional regulator
MKWSWKIATVAGIGIYIHATFFLIIGWFALDYWLKYRSVEAIFVGVGFILALFGCVLLHELGHSLAARKYGIPTRDITLLPIGGVARLERMPEDPRQELWVALAGPAVNVVIAAGLFIGLSLTSGFESIKQLDMLNAPFLIRLMTANIFLVAFNLLPAFPMDGGRVLRALLAIRMPYTRATQIAASVGQGMAFLFGFAGLFTTPFLVFIAFFVWIGAAQESSMVQMNAALSGIPVSRAMLIDFLTLSSQDTLSDAVEFTLGGSQQDFPVVEDGQVVGILLQSDLIKALARHGQNTPVSEVMRQEFQTANSFEMLHTLFIRIQSGDCRTVPVVQNGELVGLITMENVGEFLRIQAALSSEKG